MLSEYLLCHHRNDLINILRDEDGNKHFSINVNFVDLFEDNTSIGNNLLNEPDNSITEFNKSALVVQQSLLVELKEPDLSEKPNVHIRIYGLPSCPELSRVIFPKNQDLGLFLQISGTVVRTTVTKMLEYRRQYMCVKCKHKTMVQSDFQQNYVILPPKKCSNSEECKGTNLITVNLDSNNCKDYQEVKMQEQVSKLGIGTMPNSIWVTLEDDLVEMCKPGDNITVCGIVKRRWKLPSAGKKIDIELVIQANHMQVNNDTSSVTTITPEIKEQFRTFWDAHKDKPLCGRDLILRSFCPQIYGLYIVKLAVMVVLAGGSQFQKNDSGVRTRSEAHLLLVGDPGTGKSQLLRFASKVIPRSVLTTGVGSTSAGLTVTAIMENGEWQLEAGALVLSDGGLCCIDEFNSMKEHDRTSIHEAMEQQSISVAKASIVCKLNTRCSILAATNPKGHLDSTQHLTTNIALASPLLSRFDLVLILKDTIDDEWDNLVSDCILNRQKAADMEDQGRWNLETLQAYFSIIKKIHPVLTENSNRILSGYYQLQRRGSNRNKARTTVRLLDSLVRLSQAHARLMFHHEVEVMDAVIAVVLSEASMQGDAGVLSLEFNAHSAYPDDPMESYAQLARAVLGKLELLDDLEKEMLLLTSKVPACSTPNDSIEENVTGKEADVSIKEINIVRQLQESNRPKNAEICQSPVDENIVESSGIGTVEVPDLMEYKIAAPKRKKSCVATKYNKKAKVESQKDAILTDLQLINLIPSVNDSFALDLDCYEEVSNDLRTERHSNENISQTSDDLSQNTKAKRFINKFSFVPRNKPVFNHVSEGEIGKEVDLEKNKLIDRERDSVITKIKSFGSSSQSTIFESEGDLDNLDFDL